MSHQPHNACPPFVTMGLLIELIPQVHEGTIYRWNSVGAGKKRLPPYDLTVGPAQMWTLDTILDWAETHKIDLDPKALDEICQSQTVE